MINAAQVQTVIIQPALQYLNLWSAVAEKLLMLTGANESLGGTYLVQVKGPALGFYQMEPATHDDIWQNYLPYKLSLCQKVVNYLGKAKPAPERLVYDMYYATLMARIHYLRHPSPLPSNDIDAIADYYKKVWNTHLGQATVTAAINNYNKFVA